MNKLHLSVFLSLLIFSGLLAYMAYAIVGSPWIVQNLGVSASAGLQLLDGFNGNPVSSFQWGSVYSGVATTSPTFYLKNTGNIVQTVTVTTNGLTYGTLTMNAEKTVLSVGEQVPVTFTLTVNLPEGTQFSFDIVLTGTG